MTTYVLIPGSDGRAWYWHRLVPELRRLGHDTVAVDLPPASTAGWAEYGDAVVESVRTRDRLVLVAQSMGAFTAPLAYDRLPVSLLVLLNPMVPAPAETVADWWTNTGHQKARADQARADGRSAELDLREVFFHDVPPEITEQAIASADQGANLDTVFGQPWPRKTWPEVPTRFLQGREDRFFPLEFQHRLARERLGITQIDEMTGGHALALSRPEQLAAKLHTYQSAIQQT